MDIVIVAQYMRNLEQSDSGNSRFAYLANMLVDNKHAVEVVTSDFFHEGKRYFDGNKVKKNFKTTMLHEPGYPKNVCLQRFHSHKVLAKNIAQYLKTRKKPDVIYTAVPSLDVAFEVAMYCKTTNVKFIIDIQDLWPEAFRMVVNIPMISDIGFFTMTKKADFIYAAADEIIAVSQTYLERGRKVNEKVKGKVVYLGTDKDTFDTFATNVKEDVRLNCEKVKLVYVGTLGASYDLHTAFEAMRQLDEETIKIIQFIVIGDGPQRTAFEKDANDLPVVFMGMLPYCEMVSILAKCNIAINPIVAGAAQSIINKHMDYAMAGLPVINTQECPEYRNLIEEWNCGINCRCGDPESVAAAITRLVMDSSYREKMSVASHSLGETLFDRCTSYHDIVNIILREST